MAQKLRTHLDAGTVAKIINHPWPVDPGDSVNKEYADTKVDEAPQNGNAYGRRNRTWIIIDFIPEAPLDGKIYGRQDGDWTEVITGGGGDEYVNPAPVPTTVGGIAAGSTFPTPQTMQQMWDALLYPYQNPGFGSFVLNGHAGTVEVGYTIPAAVSFSWSTSNSGNVVPNSVAISDSAVGVLGSGLANDGSESFVLPAPIQKISATSHSWSISAQNTKGANFSRGASVNWRWRLYYGANVAATITEAQIKALTNGLASGYAGSYNMAAGGYKYICFAHVAGGQINSVKDALTGFNVPFTDSAPYTNVDGGGFNYALVSVTNALGITTMYRVYRTSNVLGGAVTMNVT